MMSSLKSETSTTGCLVFHEDSIFQWLNPRSQMIPQLECYQAHFIRTSPEDLQGYLEHFLLWSVTLIVIPMVL